jgi:hypothetical protein
MIYLRNMLWFIFKQMVNMGFYFTVNNIYQPYDPCDQLHCREKTEVPGENHIPTMELAVAQGSGIVHCRPFS